MDTETDIAQKRPEANKRSGQFNPEIGRISPISSRPTNQEELDLGQELITEAQEPSYGQNSVEYRRQQRVTTPQKSPRNRAGTVFKFLFYGFAGFIDLAVIVLDLCGVGLVTNRFIDPITAAIFIAIMYFKGLSLALHSKLYLSVGAAFIGEEIPVIDAAPMWTLDAWYIIKTIQTEDAAYNQQSASLKK